MFEYHTFLHHSQTLYQILKVLASFEYHTFLHHSQTKAHTHSLFYRLSTIHFYIILKRIMDCSPSLSSLSTIHFYIILKPETASSRTDWGLSTIHFYIILKLCQFSVLFTLSLSTIHFYIILKPSPSFYSRLMWFEYHTFLHHSQT